MCYVLGVFSVIASVASCWLLSSGQEPDTLRLRFFAPNAVLPEIALFIVVRRRFEKRQDFGEERLHAAAGCTMGVLIKACFAKPAWTGFCGVFAVDCSTAFCSVHVFDYICYRIFLSVKYREQGESFHNKTPAESSAGVFYLQKTSIYSSMAFRMTSLASCFPFTSPATVSLCSRSLYTVKKCAISSKIWVGRSIRSL